jgi:hypothetical protein
MTKAISQSIEMRIRVWHSAGFAKLFQNLRPLLLLSLNGRGWGEGELRLLPPHLNPLPRRGEEEAGRGREGHGEQ